MNETLGKRIADLRKKASMTQEDLAEKLGISAQAVSKWENDQTCPDITLLPTLAELLKTSLDELLTGKKPGTLCQVLPESERKDIKDMMLRMMVDSSDNDRVRIAVPMALVQVAVEMGMAMPQINGNEAFKNIDLEQILNMVRQGVMGNLMEVETGDGTTVRIFVE